jgi:hypothetical protein
MCIGCPGSIFRYQKDLFINREGSHEPPSFRGMSGGGVWIWKFRSAIDALVH